MPSDPNLVIAIGEKEKRTIRLINFYREHYIYSSRIINVETGTSKKFLED
jgi:hypothetical protein